jgi:UDP-N-acetylmuramate dehydrogenase
MAYGTIAPMKFTALDIRENIALRSMTTFKVGGPARYFVTIREPADIPRAIEFAHSVGKPFFILGGGSNVLISEQGYDGVVLKMATQGIEVLENGEERIIVRAAAGEDWDRFVAKCVAEGWWGVENMSLIPGTVGALPIQNVGAYGQEACDTVAWVEVWDIKDQSWKTMTKDECRFSYRKSIFNTCQEGRYVVACVAFALNRHGLANLSHTAVRQHLESRPSGRTAGSGSAPTLGQMRECIIALRTDGRLPDPQVTGNAGSFFKNCILDSDAFNNVLEKIQSELGAEAMRRIESTGSRYRTAEGYKIPAADLINVCGLQGARLGGAALYSRNAIVLINESGSATAEEVLALAETIRLKVLRLTGVALCMEPKLVGF